HCSALAPFPTRRSSDLSHPGGLRKERGRVERSGWGLAVIAPLDLLDDGGVPKTRQGDERPRPAFVPERPADRGRLERRVARNQQDRKSTRLNSSHQITS